MKFNTLADLERYRHQALSRVQQQPKVILGMGTCGIAAGAKEIMAALLAEIEAQELEVDIVKTGCIGMCEQEPLLDVELAGEDRVTYGKVTVELVRRIVAEHIIDGRIVEDAALARLTKED